MELSIYKSLSRSKGGYHSNICDYFVLKLTLKESTFHPYFHADGNVSWYSAKEPDVASGLAHETDETGLKHLKSLHQSTTPTGDS